MSKMPGFADDLSGMCYVAGPKSIYKPYSQSSQTGWGE